MRAISGGIKKYPITLMKDDIVFIEGDTNTNWERFQGVPLFYNGIHAGTGQMMFETPNDGTIYCEAPIIGCIIPAKYKEHIFDEVEDFIENLPNEVDDNATDTAAEFAVHRARQQNKDVELPAVLRAAAEDIENGGFGAPVEGLTLILKQEGDTPGYIYRPVNMGRYELTHAFEWCKMSNLGAAFFSDLEVEDDG